MKSLILLLLTSMSATAQPFCAPTDRILAELHRVWGEIPLYSGTATGNRVVVTILNNPHTSTWTVISISTNGEACYLASGSDWGRSLIEIKPTDTDTKVRQNEAGED